MSPLYFVSELSKHQKYFSYGMRDRLYILHDFWDELPTVALSFAPVRRLLEYLI